MTVWLAHYPAIMAKETLYILKLTHKKWYIGVTDNWKKRYHDHVSGSGPEWTRIFKPMRKQDGWPKCIKNPGKYDELTTTLEYMEKYGINNVRGSFVCYTRLSDSMKETLRKLISSCNDTCYKCGSGNHKATTCSAVYVEPEPDALTILSNRLIFGEKIPASETPPAKPKAKKRKLTSTAKEEPKSKRRRLSVEPMPPSPLNTS
jgi:hypothetical protein